MKSTVTKGIRPSKPGVVLPGGPASPGLASNGKAFRIRLVKCGMDFVAKRNERVTNLNQVVNRAISEVP